MFITQILSESLPYATPLLGAGKLDLLDETTVHKLMVQLCKQRRTKYYNSARALLEVQNSDSFTVLEVLPVGPSPVLAGLMSVSLPSQTRTFILHDP